jgi:trigger factor
MKEQGMGDIEFEAYVQKWDKDFDASAADMIQSGFIIDAIAKKHDLNWKQEDLDKKFTEYAIQTGIDKARIVEFYSRPEQMNRLTYSISEDKVIAFLLSSAKVSEVPAAKLKESLG